MIHSSDQLKSKVRKMANGDNKKVVGIDSKVHYGKIS